MILYLFFWKDDMRYLAEPRKQKCDKENGFISFARTCREINLPEMIMVQNLFIQILTLNQHYRQHQKEPKQLMFGLIYWLLIILTGQCNTPSNITLKKFRILNAAPEFDTPNEGYFPTERSQHVNDELELKFNGRYKNGLYVCRYLFQYHKKQFKYN